MAIRAEASIDIASLSKTMLKLHNRLLAAGASVRGGYFAGARYRSEPMRSPATLATIAAIHQFGAPARNIPARPFMTEGVRIGRKRIVKTSAVVLRAIAKGAPALTALRFIGESLRSAIQDGIDFGKFAPLKPSTLKARYYAARVMGVGFGKKPLIFTGQLRNRVEYRIAKQ